MSRALSKRILSIASIGLFVIAFLLPIYKTYKKPDIKAQGEIVEGKVVCMPLTEEDKITNEKYKHKKIKVVNSTREPVKIWIQTNFCDFQGNFPGEGYHCDNFAKRYYETIEPNSGQTFSIEVPCNKIGQLDVAVEEPKGVKCFNTTVNHEWVDGVAFTVNTNPTSCPVTPTKIPTAVPTGKPTMTPTPTATPYPTSTPTSVPTGTPIPTPTPRIVIKEIEVLPKTGTSLEGVFTMAVFGIALKVLSMML